MSDGVEILLRHFSSLTLFGVRCIGLVGRCCGEEAQSSRIGGLE